MKDTALEGFLFLLFALFFLGFGFAISNDAKRIKEYKIKLQKCAETQGRYDFCVQKISYEVKK